MARRQGRGIGPIIESLEARSLLSTVFGPGAGGTEFELARQWYGSGVAVDVTFNGGPGMALSPDDRAASVTSLEVSAGSIAQGETITLRASVTPATGQVRFHLTRTTFGNDVSFSSVSHAVDLADGAAVLQVEDLVPGQYTAVAVYEGDENHRPSRSEQGAFIVKADLTMEVARLGLATPTHAPLLEVGLRMTDGRAFTAGMLMSDPGRFGSAAGKAVVHLPAAPAAPPPATYIVNVGAASGVCNEGTIFSGPGAIWETNGTNIRDVFASLHEYSIVPTGTLTLTRGDEVIQILSISEGKIRFQLAEALPIGTHQLALHYSGDEHFAEAWGSVEITVTHTPTVTGLYHSVDPKGNDHEFSYSVTTDGLDHVDPTGTLTLYEGDRVVASIALDSTSPPPITLDLAPGRHTLRAVYSGDAHCLPSESAPITADVRAQTTLVMDAPPHRLLPGAPLPLTARLRVGEGMPAGSGTVRFVAIDHATSRTIDLGSSQLVDGVASIEAAGLEIGRAYTIKAFYDGDDQTRPSSFENYVQLRRPTALKLKQQSVSRSRASKLTAIVTDHQGTLVRNALGRVAFYEGKRLIGHAGLVKGRAVCTPKLKKLRPGVHNIRAVFAGDFYFSASAAKAKLRVTP